MTHKLTRRHWMLGAGAAPLMTACHSLPETTSSATPANVSIIRVPAYDQSIYATVRRILEMHRVDVRGRSVVLKPNLVEFEPGSSINTNPMLVHAALEAFRSLGAGSVRIAEGPGHRRNTLDLADAAGYFQTLPGFEDLFTDLNLDDVALYNPARQFSRMEKFYLPHTALSADLLVSMPKMKTHHWVGATLSMKNLFGVVPSGVYGWPKNVLHWAGIDGCIADLYAAFPRQFAIVDGITGMEGNGPIQGVPKHVGVVVAGADFAAVDATCCRVMGIDPQQIGYLRLVAKGPENILQIGENIRDVATPFELPPNFAHLRQIVG